MAPIVQIFLAVLLRRPSRALAIAWWWTTGRRVRARWRLGDAAVRLPESYALWRALYEPASAAPGGNGQTAVEIQTLPPIAVHLHLVTARDNATAENAVRSVLDQTFPNWRVFITTADGILPELPTDPRINHLSDAEPTLASAIAHAAGACDAAYIVPLRADCTLTPGALLGYARAAAGLAPGATALLYADQDERDGRGCRSTPWFKPAWEWDLFLAQDYLSAACALPATAVAMPQSDFTPPDPVAVFATIARLIATVPSMMVVHAPFVATTTPAGDWQRSVPARGKAVCAIVGTGCSVEDGPFGTLIVSRPLPHPLPKVSVIVPTRDCLDLLATCVEGVLDRTDYANIELLIIDNGSVEPATLAFLERRSVDPRVKIVRWPHAYNYAAINNAAAEVACGEYLCLLNNDTEIVHSGWLSALVAQAARRDIGAVGARLLYPDRSLQHGGVVIGMGGAAGHAHRGLREGDPGYFAQAYVTRTATAVTAACLVVAAEKFHAVGGFDAVGLAIAYNDVDLCLKLRGAGWRNLYAAQAVLIHHESKSRGQDFSSEHFARYMRELETLQARWQTATFQDPTHHHALDRASETYRLRI